VRHGLFVPAFDGLADPRGLADLAVLAEESGWDGFFLWDHLRYSAPVRDILDPYLCLALMAARTSRLVLGPMVTPLVRRRPQVVARQAVTLDLIADGRLVMGFGISDDYPGGDLAAFGEVTDPVARGRQLDEGIEVFEGLVSGASVQHRGEFYTVDDVSFHPTPPDGRRIPIWTAGRWPNAAPIRRAARHDGMMVIQMTDPADVVELRAGLESAGANLSTFDIVLWGERNASMELVVDNDIGAWAQAGVTWFLTGPGPLHLTFDEVRRYIAGGPPRYASSPVVSK